MPETRTARAIAERAIASAIEDIEYGDVGDLMEDLYDELGETAYDALHREAHDLVGKAVVTVTFPGSPGRTFIITASPTTTPDDTEGEADRG